jgi:hypothetical protein
MQVHLKVARSKLVRKAIDHKVRGIEVVQAQYRITSEYECRRPPARKGNARLSRYGAVQLVMLRKIRPTFLVALGNQSLLRLLVVPHTSSHIDTPVKRVLHIQMIGCWIVVLDDRRPIWPVHADEHLQRTISQYFGLYLNRAAIRKCFDMI